MKDNIKKLVCLLASYEIDEPHADLPDLKDERSYYPEFTWEKFQDEFLFKDHFGDCTGMPGICLRCFAEHILHKAIWINERL